MTRGVLIGAALIALCLCAALALIGAGAAYFYYSSRGAITRPPIISVPTALPLPASPTLPPPSPTGGVTPAAGGATPAVDEATRAMLVEIEQQVIALRGLQPSGKFELRFTTPDEYKLKTKGDFETDYSPEEAVDDARVLHALGLLPANFDLYNFYIDLYSEQILGSYDPKTKELYVIKASGKIGGVERQTYAHEFNHALQDENYDMRSLGLSDDACERDTERCAAIRALVEGDSTLLESQWLKRYGTTQDYADIGEYYSNYTSTAYDRAPCYLRDDFYWPYDDGLKFVQGLYDSGGWAAVDDAYRRPPVSTEQIMHPKLYKSGDIPEMIPAPVLTDTLGAGWRQIDSNVMGEWYTRLILLEPFRNSDPQSSDYCKVKSRDSDRMTKAAAGWGGDAYVVSYDESTAQTALVLLTTWDTETDAREFEDAFKPYGKARFKTSPQAHGQGSCWDAGDSGVSCLIRRGSDTLWVIAPDEGMVDRIVGTIPPFG